MTKNYEQWVEKLKAGDLVAYVSNNRFFPCIFKKWTHSQEGAHFIDIPYDNYKKYQTGKNNDITYNSYENELDNNWQKTYIQELTTGETKPWTSFINSNATSRFIPYSEDFLSQNQKKFYKLIKLILS